MAAQYDEEIALLRRFRLEVDDLEKQLNTLGKVRSAKYQTIQGLEALLRAAGIDPDGTAESPDEEEAQAAPLAPTILAAATAVLRDAGRDMGAKEIHDALLSAGRAVNYYTLYKTLIREVEKPDGKLVKVGEKFVLRDDLVL